MLNLFRNPLVNVNHETGIHYGAISGNTPSPECFDVGGNNWVDETYAACLKEAQLADDFDEDEFNDHYESDGDTEWSFDDGEYQIVSILTNVFLVIKSPFYTYARYCSPCVPNAGDLDSPDADNGIKTYCLGPDFFDDYSPCPYADQIYNVTDDSKVVSAQ